MSKLSVDINKQPFAYLMKTVKETAVMVGVYLGMVLTLGVTGIVLLFALDNFPTYFVVGVWSFFGLFLILTLRWLIRYHRVDTATADVADYFDRTLNEYKEQQSL